MKQGLSALKWRNTEAAVEMNHRKPRKTITHGCISWFEIETIEQA